MNGSDPTSPGSPSSPRRRYHFHTPGVLYIVVTLFLAIGALNSQNNLLFASLGLASGGVLVSGLLRGGSLMGVRIERSVGHTTHVGERLTIRYRVKNRNRVLPAFGLTITEVDSAPSVPERARGSVLTRNGATTITPWRVSVSAPRAFVAFVPARGEAEGTANVQAVRRGRITFTQTRAWTTFPFGLARKSISLDQRTSVVVHPVALPVRRGVMERLTVRSMTGLGAALAAGTGDEIYGLREYSEGDNPRLIAWKRSARTGQLLVRQNTTPSPRKIWIVVRLVRDASVMEVESAVALASALVRACSSEGAAVGLAVPGLELNMPPRTSPGSARAMQDRLAELDTDQWGEAPFPATAVRAAANVVIHAGEIDRSYGSSRSVHINAGDMDHLMVAGEALERAKSMLKRAAEPGREESGTANWVTRLWRRMWRAA